MYYFPGERWYAIRVKYRHEKITEKTLSSKNFSPLYLTYQEKSKRKDRKLILTKAFFPGYMFIKAALDAHSHVEILKSIGVVELLHNSQGPLPISEEQIENVARLRDYKGKIVSFTEFAKGMLVKIIQGPLAGLIGRIDDIRRDLIQIGIDSVPGTVCIQVSSSQIEPLKSDHTLADLIK